MNKKTRIQVAGITTLFLVLYGILGAELGRMLFIALVLLVVLGGIYYPVFIFRRTLLEKKSGTQMQKIK